MAAVVIPENWSSNLENASSEAAGRGAGGRDGVVVGFDAAVATAAMGGAWSVRALVCVWSTKRSLVA